MTRSLPVLASIGAAGLVWLLYGYRAAPESRADFIQRQRESLQTPTTDTAQKRCRRQAREQFQHSGWDDQPRNSFSYRYSSAMKRCFIEFDLIITDGTGRTDMIRSLADADGRDYGEYMQVMQRDGKPSDMLPTVCEVNLPSGEEMDCNSLGQFDEFIKGYMN